MADWTWAMTHVKNAVLTGAWVIPEGVAKVVGLGCR